MTWRAKLLVAGVCLASNAIADAAVEKWWSGFHDPVLESLVERAVQNNVELKIAASRVREVRAGAGATRAARLPMIEASESEHRVGGGIQALEGNLFHQGFDASWEIDFFGGKRHALDAAVADAAAAEEARRETLITLLGEVARNYGELRGSARRLAIARESITVESEVLQLTEARVAAGLEAELERQRQKSQLAVSQAKLPVLEAARQASLNRLSVLLGEEPGALEGTLGEAGPLPATPSLVAAGLPGDLLKRRPDVRQADAEMAAAGARVGVARSEFFPKITLTGIAGRLGTGVTLGATNFFAVGPAVRLPIFTGGRLKANLRIEQERLTQAQLRYRDTVLRAIEETEDALTAYGREQERRDRVRAAAQALMEGTRLSMGVYERGLSDFLAVLDAHRRQLEMEDELAQREVAVFVDLVSLYKALGGGWGS